MGLDGLCRWVERDKAAFGVVFFIRVGVDGLCRWIEWDKVALGVFFSSSEWDLMDCARGPYMAAMWSVIPLTLL